jgi:predicted nucleic acid-binding protein
MVFVDSNVILDVITADPRWQAWSEQQISHWLERGRLLINPIVYAEIAFACEAIEGVDELLPMPTTEPGAVRARRCWRIF